MQLTISSKSVIIIKFFFIITKFKLIIIAIKLKLKSNIIFNKGYNVIIKVNIKLLA